MPTRSDPNVQDLQDTTLVPDREADLGRDRSAASTTGEMLSRAPSNLIEDPLPLGYILSRRHRIEVLLGRGGMSQVYAGHDLHTDREVAIKILLKTQGESEPDTQRFFREKKILAKLSHPNIVDILDFGTYNDPYRRCSLNFIVMPRLKGESLFDRLRRVGRLPLPEVARIGVQICDAVAALHRRKIIHRDLKPANVFLAYDDQETDVVKLLDFGIAKDLELQSGTQTGDFAGTFKYAAPEQKGSFRNVDKRADLYSIGLLLYECLAGFPTAWPIPPLLETVPDLPTTLCERIDEALAPNPVDRSPTAERLRDALIPFVRSKRSYIEASLPATIATNKHRSWRGHVSRRIVVITTGALLLIMAFVLFRLISEETAKQPDDFATKSALPSSLKKEKPRNEPQLALPKTNVLVNSINSTMEERIQGVIKAPDPAIANTSTKQANKSNSTPNSRIKKKISKPVLDETLQIPEWKFQ